VGAMQQVLGFAVAGAIDVQRYVLLWREPIHGKATSKKRLRS
jgi:hypothetical protein